MAELFLARDPQATDFRVIKRILPYLSHEAEFVQMFLDEARIAAQLHHENVIQLFELGKLEDSIFIAMEFVDGVDLRNVLQAEVKRGGTIPLGIAAWIGARVCDGLHYAHNRVGLDGRPMEIIHRDISPQNVMVGYDGRVKLVDFGIAKAGAFMERSKPGVIKGKFLYLSPEQLSLNPIDHRADLFALGTMLYEITTGKSPFHKITTEAVILAIRNEDPPPPHLVTPQYPMELSRIVMKCLTKDRTRRYQQAGEIAADLARFLVRHGPTTQADVAKYVASVFGDDGERTVMNVPGLDLDALRKELAAPPPLEPSPPEPSAREEPVDVTRTEMARPLDLKAILGPQPQPSVLSAPSLSSIGDLLDDQHSTLSGSGRDLPERSATSTTSPRPGAVPRARPAPLPSAPPLFWEPPTRPDAPLSRQNARRSVEEDRTADFGSGSGVKEPWLTPGRIIAAAVGAAVLLIVGAAVVRATRTPEPVPEIVKEAVPAPTDAGAEARPDVLAGPGTGEDTDGTVEGGAAEGRPEKVRVLFRAPRGTKIRSGETEFLPGRTYRLAPGTLPVSWRCPNGQSGSSPFNIEEGNHGRLSLSISCRRK